MNDADIRKILLEELIKVAPDLDPATIGPDEHLQDDLEIDSMASSIWWPRCTGT